MAGEVLQLNSVLHVDDIARRISEMWQTWNSMRTEKVSQWEEVRKYKYAVDTTTTTNSSLPWKNKTTYPKLTQISDNLWANYIKSLFPKRQWVIWEGFDKKSEDADKKAAIENYMMNTIERSGFKLVVGELLNDWIQYGNCIATAEWRDDRVEVGDRQQVGFVGPSAVRISPLDIVFNPIAPTFQVSPKIIRKFITFGDLKKEIERLSPSDEHAQELFTYLMEARRQLSSWPGDLSTEDQFLQVDGFTSYRQYLDADYAEVLTFHGDLYDREKDKFYRNHIITIVDRHKIIATEPNPSAFGYAPIYHSGWRTRQDNLWAMGPLDNLVGMQYRIDHLENLKADVFDLNAFPPLKVKGYVEDFEWGPMERIYVSEEGDVEMVAPHFEILNANLEIEQLERKMEEIAGAPKEAMGIRSPGEKTKYEVQRLENASGRIFQSKLELFEEQVVEPLLTAMLELARRRMTTEELRVFDDELKVATFQTLTPQDITGNGRLRPVAAKHFAEQAEKVQNATAFFNSQIGMDPLVNVHVSGIEVAKMFEDLLELKGYKLVTPFVRVSEQAEMQRLMNSSQEQVITEAGTPSGLTPDDYSPGMNDPIPQ